MGYCHGIENYSRHLTGRAPGEPPPTLLDYFPRDFLVMLDESHITVPQLNGMYNGDRSRKETLVQYGFRLPSALDNRPLKFEEFEARVKQVIYVSATPGPYELERAERIAEQIIRPTGLMDPEILVRPATNQVDDLLGRIRERVERNERILVTTLTKRMAEDLTEYLSDLGVKVRYLHSDIKTIERMDIIRDLRLGVFDVLVGINLLREGLDLPEVSLVAILDADKEGFLRSERSLIQTCGRAARNVNGTVILYADQMTGSMQRAIEESNRRRADPDGIQRGPPHHAGLHPEDHRGYPGLRLRGGLCDGPQGGGTGKTLPEPRGHPGADRGSAEADEGGGQEARIRGGGPSPGRDQGPGGKGTGIPGLCRRPHASSSAFQRYPAPFSPRPGQFSALARTPFSLDTQRRIPLCFRTSEAISRYRITIEEVRTHAFIPQKNLDHQRVFSLRSHVTFLLL